MRYGLPKTVEIDGEEFAIRYDYRVILDVFEAMNDPDSSEEERALDVLQIFYIAFDDLTDYDAAMKAMFCFINGGEEPQKQKGPHLVDWPMDFPRIIAPVNRVLGYEVRAVDYDIETNTGGVHWWTILSAYAEIGDCLFAQIVRIRDKKAKGKPLDKSDREFYRKNRDIIDIKQNYSEAENNLVNLWTGEKNRTAPETGTV